VIKMAQEIRQGDLVAFVSDTETGECGECYRNMVYGNVTRVWQRRNPHVPQTLTIVTGDGKTYVRYAERCTLVMDVEAGACEPVEPTCEFGCAPMDHGPDVDHGEYLDANHGPNCGCGYHTAHPVGCECGCESYDPELDAWPMTDQATVELQSEFNAQYDDDHERYAGETLDAHDGCEGCGYCLPSDMRYWLTIHEAAATSHTASIQGAWANYHTIANTPPF
jgi:hypothetical protein